MQTIQTFTQHEVDNLQLINDGEQVSIFYEEVKDSEVFYKEVFNYIKDEWEEDSDIVESIIEGVILYHTDRQELLRRLCFVIEG